ncbi:16S rRNA (guanine(527)-N(7))-methyltransferase RsmG [Roseovarius arcticus]|uniref:16S rRNA (guanine(527)-N(7))-methyltransferase RsmG n=1 Tax=Roseovarius arcticus TaxID=2547404 RepID=UPI0011105D51|nr:16S rRNA (guanine(527)-N(7))-methyltransferase RsmG [Roseovarius arcticus]
MLDNVSRETLDRLRALENITLKWTKKINLISRESAEMLWERHILDSIQVYRIAPSQIDHWADLGSGGGYPGLVVAILAHATNAPPRITLVESDERKCAFLRAALREVGVVATVINDRIEAVPPLTADILSARALADLPTLLAYAEQHLAANGTAIFPKGAQWENELNTARTEWKFDCTATKSELKADAAILSIKGVSRV